MPFPMSNPQPDARHINSLPETPAASCGSHADGRPETNPLASRPRPGTKAPPDAAPVPCLPNSLQPPESYSARTHLQAPRGGPRQPPRAAGHASPGGQRHRSMRLLLGLATGQQRWAAERAGASARPRRIARPPRPRLGLP